MRIISEDRVTQALGAHPAQEPRVVAGGNLGTPRRLLALVDTSLERYRLFMLNATSGVPLPRHGLTFETPFVGPAMRNDPDLEYLPTRLSLVPRLFASTHLPDIVLVNVSSPRDGKVSLGIEVNILPAAIEKARGGGGLVLAAINRHMPYTYGDGEIPCDVVDLAVEIDEELPPVAPTPPDETTTRIGNQLAGCVPDGSTLQLGIGHIPDGTLLRLTERRGLRIWSEALSNGVLTLERAGGLDPHQTVIASFVTGSHDLYRWVDANPRVRLLRTEMTNDPARIAQHHHMISINTALQVDLFAQANASHIEHRIYSGFGGQPDFVVGALHSPGGQAIVALGSWHTKSETSAIVPLLSSPATSFQHSLVITEQGQASIWGERQRAQVRMLIEATAHPAARPGLWAHADDLGLA